MADLVSRKTAIEEIGPLLYAGDFVSALIHLPAIDAIPVEWLCGKIRDEGKRGNVLKAEYLKELIFSSQI